MPKETYYFPHDYNARNDDKAAALIFNHGATGYGIYWIVAEILHEDEHSRIEFTEKKLKRLADSAKTEYEKFRQVIDDCIERFELFRLEDGYLKCARVDRNKEKRTGIKNERKEAGKKGAEKRWADKMANATKKIAIATEKMAKDSKGMANHSKEEKIKGKEIKDDGIPPPNFSFLPTEDLKVIALKDENFVAAFYRIGIMPEKLSGWLDAFHRHLAFTGETIKQEKDYRKHFGNWVVKIPYRTTRAEDYNPVKKNDQPQTGNRKQL